MSLSSHSSFKEPTGYSFLVIFLGVNPLLVKQCRLISPVSLLALLLIQILNESKLSNYAENWFLKFSFFLDFQ